MPTKVCAHCMATFHASRSLHRFCSQRCGLLARAVAGFRVNPPAPLDMTEVIARYRAGESCADLGRAFGLDSTTIARRLRAVGVEIRPPWVDAAVKNSGRGGPGHHNFKGGRQVVDGYVALWMPDHPEANSRGYVREHRMVWHDQRGPIPDGWHVHHLNHDRADNRIENLVALAPSAHSAHHAGHLSGSMTREQKRAAGRKGAAVRWGHPLP